MRQRLVLVDDMPLLLLIDDMIDDMVIEVTVMIGVDDDEEVVCDNVGVDCVVLVVVGNVPMIVDEDDDDDVGVRPCNFNFVLILLFYILS